MSLLSWSSLDVPYAAFSSWNCDSLVMSGGKGGHLDSSWNKQWSAIGYIM